jgi:hypothetical protein
MIACRGCFCSPLRDRRVVGKQRPGSARTSDSRQYRRGRSPGFAGREGGEARRRQRPLDCPSVVSEVFWHGIRSNRHLTGPGGQLSQQTEIGRGRRRTGGGCSAGLCSVLYLTVSLDVFECYVRTMTLQPWSKYSTVLQQGGFRNVSPTRDCLGCLPC